MKKWLVFLLSAVLLTACGNSTENANNESGVTIEEYENRISQALKEMGDDTNLKIVSNETSEDGKKVIALSQNIFIYLDTGDSQFIKTVTLGMTSDAFIIEKEDFDFAFLLLVGTVDDSLSFGDRNNVIKELGLSDETIFSKDYTKVYQYNKIMYTYKGSIKDNFLLQAEYKK